MHTLGPARARVAHSRQPRGQRPAQARCRRTAGIALLRRPLLLQPTWLMLLSQRPGASSTSTGGLPLTPPPPRPAPPAPSPHAPSPHPHETCPACPRRCIGSPSGAGARQFLRPHGSPSSPRGPCRLGGCGAWRGDPPAPPSSLPRESPAVGAVHMRLPGHDARAFPSTMMRSTIRLTIYRTTRFENC